MRLGWVGSLGAALALALATARADELPGGPPVVPPPGTPAAVAPPSPQPAAAIPEATVPGPALSPEGTPTLSGAPRPWLAATGWVAWTGCPVWPDSGWLGRAGKLRGDGTTAEDACPPPCGTYFNAEYLLWWMQRSHLPPLVTQGSAAVEAQAAITGGPHAGALGLPSTLELFGGTTDLEEHSGGRFTLGHWFGASQAFGLEANFLFLGRRGTDFTNSLNGNPGPTVLARPFFDVTVPREDAEVVANPGEKAGNVAVSLRSALLGAEANARVALFSACGCRVELLGGYRFLQLDEEVSILESMTPVPLDPQNTVVRVFDQFATHNQFHGGQLGATAAFGDGRWSLDLRGEVAWGLTTEIVNIRGSTRIITPFRDDTFAGGLLALPTNIGRYSRSQGSVVPEAGLNLGYQVTDHLRATLGYTFLYWSRVARPGNAIDPAINPTQLPSPFGPGSLVGLAQPVFTFKDAEFWAQGITFGLDFRY